MKGGKAKSLTWRLSVKGSEDRRTDLQSKQLPSPDSWGQCWRGGRQPSSQAPVKLPFEMQLSRDSFSHSLATHTNRPQYIYQVTTLILAVQSTPGPMPSRTVRGGSPKSQCSWLWHRTRRLPALHLKPPGSSCGKAEGNPASAPGRPAGAASRCGCQANTWWVPTVHEEIIHNGV